MEEEVYVKCNNCGADDYTVVFPAGKAQIHRVVKCNNCGLIYANPQINSTAGGKMAREAEEVDLKKVEKEVEEYKPEKFQYLQKQYVHLKDFVAILEYFEKKGIKKGSLLEIGSHAGVFLNTAKEMGWEVTGIEPNPLPRIYSEKNFGLKVYSESFEQAPLKDDTFDVVIATHVIEHIYDPKVFIKKAYDLLKPGGVLVLETPTYDSLAFSLLKHRERSVRCPGHIYFYTKKSLADAVKGVGFKVVNHVAVGRTLTMDRLFHNFALITGKKKFFNNISKKLNLQKRTVHINAHDMQRIYAEKV